MRITYKKLWKLLIDREMNKQDLKRECNISSASVAKLGKCENITTDVLVRICEGLNCKLEDIMELEEDVPAQQYGKAWPITSESDCVAALMKMYQELTAKEGS